MRRLNNLSTFMKGTALESVMDIRLMGPETVGQMLEEYQNRFLPETRLSATPSC